MKIWKALCPDKEKVRQLAKQYNLGSMSAMLLEEKNFPDEESIRQFLTDTPEFESPMMIKDMDKAVLTVKESVKNNEKICVYGDYDADGVTSTTLMYSFLKSRGADVMYYIPARETEGYGLNNNAVDYLYSQGIKLIVTVDNGISAFEQVELANSYNMKVVITDHHAPPQIIPNACAVVDPHRMDDTSSFKHFSGVGLAFKFAVAYDGENADVEALLDDYSDLAAVGTIGDVVSLTGENRALVKEGLKRINRGTRLGLSMLKEASGLNKDVIKSGDISFTICPRINAGGRLGLSHKSVNLLITNDETEAKTIAGELNEDNLQRQRIEKEILESVDNMLLVDDNVRFRKILVIAGEGWHQGVIGIVAARIKDRYGKPVIIITYDGDKAKGSGRSVEGFRMCDGVEYCKDLLTIYGGHPMAAGMSLPTANIDAFRDRINEYADRLTNTFYPVVELACRLIPSKVNIRMVESLSQLEPYGAGNPTPVFGLYNVNIIRITPLSDGKHTKLTLESEQRYFDALYFNMPTDRFLYMVGDNVNLAVTAGINEYNSVKSISYIIKDICFSRSDNEALLRSSGLFDSLMCGKKPDEEMKKDLAPTRDDCAVVYRFLRKNNGFRYSAEALHNRLSDSSLSYGKLCVIITAFDRLGLIESSGNFSMMDIRLAENPPRVDILSAPIIQKLVEL